MSEEYSTDKIESVNSIPISDSTLEETLRKSDQNLEADRLANIEDVVDDFGIGIVTKIVSLEDDETLPVVTARFFLLSSVLAVFAGTLGQIYYFKPQVLYISSSFLLLFAYFGGKLLERILPSGILNPGRFNKKEHALIVITANTASIAAFANELIAAEYLFYNNTIPTWIGILLVLSSQLIGYGYAGFFRETLVYPRHTYYPTSLTQVALYENLHNGDGVSKKMTRYFFSLVAVTFCYEWLPQYVAPSLVGISVICLATAHLKNPTITKIFGGTTSNEGMALFSIGLDWNTIAGFGSPMVFPWTTIINVAVGVSVCCIFMPYLYFSNTWNATWYPWMGLGIYSPNSTAGYNQTSILDSNNNIDLEELSRIGLPGLSSSNALYIIGLNMSLTGGIMHIALWYSSEVMTGLKNIFARKGESSNNDPYHTVMLKYPEVPLWWYLVLFALSFAGGMIVTQVHHGLDWYMFILAILFSLVFVFVSGFIGAVTGQNMNVSSIVQMLGGFIKPGNPVANMYFTLYGSNATTQAVNMLTDLKMGQYMKIPPRATFFGQCYGAVIGAICGYFITVSIVTNNKPALLTVDGSTQWNGAQPQSFNANAITWGGLAKQMYAPGGPYEWVLYSFFLGFIMPVPFYLLHKLYPKVGFNYFNFAIIPAYFGYFCSGINSSIMSYFAIAAFSQYYLRKYKPAIFNKYQYITSAALDAGNQICALILAVSVGGAISSPMPFPNWLLNPDFQNGMWFQDGCYNINNDYSRKNSSSF